MIELFCFCGIIWFISKVDNETWVSLFMLIVIGFVGFNIYCDESLSRGFSIITIVLGSYFVGIPVAKEIYKDLRNKIKGIPTEA